MSRKERIYEAVTQQFNLQFVQVKDESHRHSVPQGAESHFNLVMVSEDFEALSRIKRHRLVNTCLADEFNKGLHALRLNLFTPEEWLKKNEQISNSPACRSSEQRDGKK